ncbi:MAG: DEAD/DEAH box helicase [Deltaproteobacteria bacterium]|nr:DEAD/DEAH box helicase [Deltaproteobacteria bacterium]
MSDTADSLVPKPAVAGSGRARGPASPVFRRRASSSSSSDRDDQRVRRKVYPRPAAAWGEGGPGAPLTLRDRLSRLTFTQAAKMLGPEGRGLLSAAGRGDAPGGGEGSRLRLGDDELVGDFGPRGRVVFTVSGPGRRLTFSCSVCDSRAPDCCPHAAAVLSRVLEEKTALGLAARPVPKVPLERLGEDELVGRAVSERAARVREDGLVVAGRPPDGRVWGDYRVANPKSGRSYRVSVRGLERGQTYCECPDFRVNTLGLCKHTLAVTEELRLRPRALARAGVWEPQTAEAYLDYAVSPPALRLQAPPKFLEGLPADKRVLVAPLLNGPIDDVSGLVACLAMLERLGRETTVFPDAAEHVELELHRLRLRGLAEEIRRDPASHPLRKTLLKVELLPYQLDGVAFAAGRGRAVIADDMGLGKTIQGVAVAELLAREAGVGRVLVVCPASLKSQWREEIARFTDRGSRTILGTAAARGGQYSGDAFFTICNYEQVTRDAPFILREEWDLVILDEAQRVKNWETAGHRAVASIRSRHMLILTGTPLENSLGELFTLVRLVDAQVLGPAFRFLNSHKQTDERGRLLAWTGLGEIRSALAPVMIRRTRGQVLAELPPRQTEIVRVAPTDQQLEMHAWQARQISRIISKPYLTEMDFLRLKKALLICRLAADATALVDKERPGFSSKLAEFRELMASLLAEPDRKIVVFSEWTGMLDLAEEILAPLGAVWERLDGSVPQARRGGIVARFAENPGIRVFLSTNAGAVGLNLQAADTVVNLDLPWNPAVLEQRIGRAHRMGQTRPVQVYLLVTAETIEERLLSVLGAKNDLFWAALDMGSEVDMVAMTGGVEELRNRLEVLLGRRPDAPVAEPLAALIAAGGPSDDVPEPSAKPAADSARDGDDAPAQNGARGGGDAPGENRVRGGDGGARADGAAAAGGTGSGGGASAGARGSASGERVALAGGRLFEAVLNFLDEIAPPSGEPGPDPADGDGGAASPGGRQAGAPGPAPPRASAVGKAVLDYVGGCLRRDEEGRPSLTLTLPDDKVIGRLAGVLSRLFGG